MNTSYLARVRRARPSATPIASLPLVAVLAACAVTACASAAGPGASAPTTAVPAAVAATPTPAVAAQPGALVESEVRAFMGKVAVAARDRDVARLAAALADDCTIELRSRIDGRERTTSLTKAEYVLMLDRGYLAMKDLQDYDYRIVGMQVEIDADGRAATVRSQVRETAVMGGRTSATRSEETTRVVRRDGRLIAVAVSALTEAATD